MRCSITWKLLSKAVVLSALSVLMAACTSSGENRVVGGDPQRGEDLAARLGCAACHAIPRMPTQGRVGPPLSDVGSRAYLAGRVPNTPENMVRWIRFPQKVDPDTLMPQLGISETDGRDLAEFLYALR